MRRHGARGPTEPPLVTVPVEITDEHVEQTRPEVELGVDTAFRIAIERASESSSSDDFACAAEMRATGRAIGRMLFEEAARSIVLSFD